MNRERLWPTKFCDRARAIFGLRPAGELDCGGHRSYQGWLSRRALGCDRRRGHTRTIKEWSANVWQQVRDLREWPIKKQTRRIVLEEVEPHESRHCSWRAIPRL